jgi:putative flippase GtrA
MRELASSGKQFARFALIGVLSNGLFYALYLILTHEGVRPSAAMTLTYALAVASTFFLNRTWTFAQQGGVFRTFARYIASYAIGYLINLGILESLTFYAGLTHQLAQGMAILSVAVCLFLLQKYWVFKAIA